MSKQNVTTPLLFAAASLLFSLLGSRAGAQTDTIGYTGAMQQYVVPAGITAVTVDVTGAMGGWGGADGIPAEGGMGGRIQATLSVTPGQVLYLYVGGMGGSGYNGHAGYNGGGKGGLDGGGGGGGGATDIRIGDTTLASRVIIAGGGGGGGGGIGLVAGNGGGGGNTTGMAAQKVFDDTVAQGGSPTTGGAGGIYYTTAGAIRTAGAQGSLGLGGDGRDTSSVYYGGGGGGGGYYGGGGGAVDGGGGGSSYVNSVLASNVTMTQGVDTGNGYIIILPTAASAVPAPIHRAAINVFPNPATNIVYIDAPAAVNVIISTIDGKAIINKTNTKDIDISSLTDGMYLICIYDDNGGMLKMDKLVKER